METAAPRSETDKLLLAVAKGKQSVARLAEGVDREEVLTLLESLRADEENHRARLRSLLHGMEADRAIVATRLPAWRRTVRRRIPAAHLYY